MGLSFEPIKAARVSVCGPMRKLLLTVGEAELHASSLVGEATVEDEKKDLGLQYSGLVQVKRGVPSLLGSHGAVRWLPALHAVPLGQEDPEAEGFELLRQSLFEQPLRFGEQWSGELDQHGRTNIPETQASCAIGIPKRALGVCALGAYGRAKPTHLTGNPIVVKRP